MRAAASWQTLENVEVECTHCGVRMTPQAGSRVRYFRCGSCHRWVSSTYTDVFRADSKFRTWPAREEDSQQEQFQQVKDKLERWLAAVEEQDPYRALGVSPLDTTEAIRARYRQLALEQHPDRGGSAERMQELNAAYERILRHRERRRSEVGPVAPALARATARTSPALPVRSR